MSVDDYAEATGTAATALETTEDSASRRRAQQVTCYPRRVLGNSKMRVVKPRVEMPRDSDAALNAARARRAGKTCLFAPAPARVAAAVPQTADRTPDRSTDRPPPPKCCARQICV